MKALLLLLACVAVSHAVSFDYSICDPGVDANTYPVMLPQYKLLQVQILARHGDRRPVDDDGCWPNNKVVYDCNTWPANIVVDGHVGDAIAPRRLYRTINVANKGLLSGSCWNGQMSEKGFKQLNNNGQYLRKVYVEKNRLLNPKYNSSEMILRSDAFIRTVESLQSMMDGLYPPEENVNGRIPLVDVQMYDKEMDVYHPDNTFCPLGAKMMADAKKSPEYLDHMNKYGIPLRHKLAVALNMRDDDVNINKIHDCAYVHKCNKLDVPPTLSDDLIMEVHAERMYEYLYVRSYPNITTGGMAQIGHMIREIIDTLPIHSHDKPRLTDYHIMNILQNTNTAWNGNWAPFASIIAIETYQLQPGDYYLRMLFNNKVMKFGGCAEICPMEQALSIMKSIAPADMDARCVV